MFNSVRKLDPWKVFGLLVVTGFSAMSLGLTALVTYKIFFTTQ